MRRIDTATARPNLFGEGKSGFHDNTDLQGQDPTYLSPEFLNAVQEELMTVVETAGLQPSTNHNDLYNAILLMQEQLKHNMTEKIYPVGSWHGSDATDYDPSSALEDMFGRRTTWRLRPYAPYGVLHTSDALMHISHFGVSSTGSNRLSTSRIWKRMPDEYVDPNLSLSANVGIVNEGNSVTFTLLTANMPVGKRLTWLISGSIDSSDISPAALSGTFTVPQSGVMTYTVNIRNDAKTEGSEILTFGLLDYPGVSASVTINDTSFNIVHPENNVDLGTQYGVGTHAITVQSGEYKRFVLIGGGGGGAAARARENTTLYPLSDGRNGQSTKITLGGTILAEAGAGTGGKQGEWNNGSSFKNGTAGGAGYPQRNGAFYSIRTLEGKVGIANMHDQSGGSAVYPGHNNGAGGAGAVGVGSSGGISGYGYSGGGGSAAALDFVYFNNSSAAVTLELIVGAGGAGGQKGSEAQDRVGENGLDGIAYVGTLGQI